MRPMIYKIIGRYLESVGKNLSKKDVFRQPIIDLLSPPLTPASTGFEAYFEA